MKLITLNTHSLIEEHYEEKLHAFAEVIRKEKPDILAMQEVNQLACEEIWPDEKLPGFVRCRGFSLPVRKSCGKACRAFKGFRAFLFLDLDLGKDGL